MRELINMFSDHESRDELGIGQVRDAFSDLLFPGTSTIHTRARYFLIVPWCSQAAERKGMRAKAFADMVERNERAVIDALKKSGDFENMIGGRAGVKVRTLPSAIYGAALVRYGIRTGEYDGGVNEVEADELTDHAVGTWHRTLPSPPDGFPWTLAGGLAMTRVEAAWLRERVLATASGSLLAQLLEGETPADPDSFAPWDDPSTLEATEDVRSQLDHARRFSMAIFGAALLYNLLIAEWYESKGLNEVVDPIDAYREALTVWAEDVSATRTMSGWERRDMWDLVGSQNPRISSNVRARAFIDRWLDIVAADPAGLADSEEARRVVEGRERQVKGSQSRLVNEKLLRTWSGASGSKQLVYRWPQVRRMVTDIRTGLGADLVVA